MENQNLSKWSFKMRFTCLFVMVIALLQVPLGVQATQPEVGIIYFVPSDRTAQSDIDSKIDTLIKAAQTAYADEMEAEGYGRKTFTFKKNDDDTVKVNHITGDYTNAYYEGANKWEVWDKVKKAGHDPSQNIYITFMDFSSGDIDGWCGTGGDWLDGSLGGVVNMAVSADCFDGDHGVAILVHELGHALGLRHDYRNYPDYSIDLVEDDPMVTSACAAKWLNGHPYFNNYTTTPTETTLISMSTPSISGSNVSVTFTITDADGLHQAHFFTTIYESYGDFGDLSLLDCASLDSTSTSTTATFTTSALTSDTGSVTLRVMDALGRSTEQLFSVDLSSLPSTSSADVNGDGTVNVRDLVEVANKFGEQGDNPADVNNDGEVDIKDLVLTANALGSGSGSSAPSIGYRDLEVAPTRADVQQWLRQAQQMNLTDPTFQRGILVLQQLLVALTPKETVLLPNYPNPFNPETWIPYHLVKPANVSISIYAVDGKLVRTLELGHQSVGIYESRSRAAYWDGKNQLGEPVASGVYFYTLSAGEFTATRKMLIRK